MNHNRTKAPTWNIVKNSINSSRNNMDELYEPLKVLANTPTLYEIACHQVLIGILALQFKGIRFK